MLDVDFRRFLPGGKVEGPIDDRLLHRIRRPLQGATIGVFNRKGGDGKTTVAAYLGLTLAALRNGSVLAVDGDTISGSLGYLLAPDARATLSDLAGRRAVPRTMEEFTPFITRAARSLYVIAGDTDEVPVDKDRIDATIRSLTPLYDVSIFDAANAAPDTPGRALLERSQLVVLVTGPSIDSVRAAERTLVWLNEHFDATGSHPPVLTVINGIPSSMPKAQIEHIEELFDGRGSAVARIPWDEHLSEGTMSASLEALARPTQAAFRELAATTVQLVARRKARHNERPARV